jgi:hypothetical protein
MVARGTRGWLGNSARQLASEVFKRRGKAFLPPDNHIVGSRRHVMRGMDAHRFAQPALDPIADHGIADLLGHRETDPGRFVASMGQHFEQEKRPATPFSLAHGQELGAFLEPNRRFPSGPAFAGHRSPARS